ncbi:MAG: hypothetical protein V4712_15155 [Pseudomonadota bacterium]
MTDSLPVIFAAKAVAGSARCGGLTQHMVDDLRTKAEELLARGDALRLEVLAFATMYEEHRWDAYAMEKLGESLDRAVHEALNPTAPPLRHRRDIDD